MIAAGIVLPVIGLAVAGFVVMLLCSIWALNSWRQMTAVALGATPGQRRASAVPSARSGEPRGTPRSASG